MPTPIPQPKETFVLGNIPDLDRKLPLASFIRLAKIYGPIYQLHLRDYVTVISSQELVDFVSKEELFEKKVGGALKEVRSFAGDGLFTAFGDEPNWHLAHRVLLPAFGPIAIRKMQPQMLDIITQMLLHWEHHAGQPFEAADHYTRLTFDTIGWCAFKYRFNSFHTDNLHPFVDLMVKLLVESGDRIRRPDVVRKMMYKTEAQYKANIAALHEQCDEIVAARRRDPDPEAHDLLNKMILDQDPDSGAHLSDENIRYQMVTFLIAGHETTSGLLSFATYYMLKNPRTLRLAREEADKAIEKAGGSLLKINAAELHYIDAILKEALRLNSTAPLFGVQPKSQDGATLPGGYHVPHGQSIAVLLDQLHRDPKAWGDDAEEFKPERWLDGREIKPNSYKPFGNGARACIGRGFAIQEAQLAIALIVARFNIEMADSKYDLTIKQTLTIKPDNFRIIARPRHRNQSLLTELIAGSASKPKPTEDVAIKGQGSGKLTFMYGSNCGSCEGLAKELAAEGSSKGFDTTVGELDRLAASGKLPTDSPVVICTASYEGQPTDNARQFVDSLKGMTGTPLTGVRYAVFGAGHHDWATTFHKIPKYIDDRLSELGAERIMPLHTADAAGDVMGDFETFKSAVWKQFGAQSSDAAKADKVTVRFLAPTANAAASALDAGIETVGEVVSNVTLVEGSDVNRLKKHITIRLPAESAYRAGDYLAILPKNPAAVVDRALEWFGIKHDQALVLSGPIGSLPRGTPLAAGDVLSSFVELSQTVPKRVLEALREVNESGVQPLIDDYERVVRDKVSLLEVLEQIGSKDIGLLLQSVPKMKIRQYSISSSPLVDPTLVTLTFDVHTSPNHRAEGVASTYLASLAPGDKLMCAIKSSSDFHLPSDPATSVVCFAAGTGIAPFRGFIAERAMQKAAGRDVGKVTLFYGCRNEADLLHREEMLQWVDAGVLDFQPVFSRETPANAPEHVKYTGQKYVQDRVWDERESLREAFESGAMFYTCGSGARMAADLKKTLVAIIKDAKDFTDEEAAEVMERLAKERYRTDVFL